MGLVDFQGGMQDALRQMVLDRIEAQKVAQAQKMAESRLALEQANQQFARERFGIDRQADQEAALLDQQAALRKEMREGEAHTAGMEKHRAEMGAIRTKSLADEEARYLGPEIDRQKEEREYAHAKQMKELELAGQKEVAGIRTRAAQDLASQRAEDRPDKPATQGEFTAAAYAGRMEQAERHLAALDPSINKMSLPSFELQVRSPVSALQSKDMQSYMQASRNFINAVLRRESGAVISPSEFAEARKQYLQQPGDTLETRAQKRANRQYVMATMKRSAGKAYEAPMEPGAGDGADSEFDFVPGRGLVPRGSR